jgi:hypothetical protein
LSLGEASFSDSSFLLIFEEIGGCGAGETKVEMVFGACRFRAGLFSVGWLF